MPLATVRGLRTVCQALAEGSAKLYLDLQQRGLHAENSAIDIDQLGRQADKVVVVLIDDLHKALVQHLQVRLQLRTERLQWNLRAESMMKQRISMRSPLLWTHVLQPWSAPI